MFDLLEEIKNILKIENIKTALDLWAGRGQLSLFCANHWIKTVAVDNEKSSQWQFDKNLLENENIEFKSENIEDYLVKTNKTFDLVLLMNVIAFIKKDVFLTDTIQQIIHKINKKWYFFLSFFFDDDPTMQSPNINFYTFDNFVCLEKYFEIIKKFDIRKDDLHKPYGIHKHHIWYIIAKKK